MRDYNSSQGWVIVSNGKNKVNTFTNASLLRNGMLFGWFDSGGGTGALGCPSSQEMATSIPGPSGEKLRLIVQHFDNGALEWITGMDHSQLVSGGIPAANAIRWAALCVNSPAGTCNYTDNTGVVVADYAGYCLGFVARSFDATAGVKLGNVPYGRIAAASQVWNFADNAARRGTGTGAPGTLATWGPEINLQGTDGHIALNIGLGSAISTSIGGNRTIHVTRVPDFPSNQGWVSPVPAPA